jgi:hypothetical protein
MFHWLVIRERKDKERDAEVERIHETFKVFAKEYAMDNYTMALDKLMNAYMRPLEFDMLQDQIQALQLEVQELKEKKDQPVAEEHKRPATFGGN